MRQGGGRDTAPGAPRHGRPSVQRARSLGQGVHLVHPTQSGLNALFLVTVWDTIHEHCSQDFSKKRIIKSNQIK